MEKLINGWVCRQGWIPIFLANAVGCYGEGKRREQGLRTQGSHACSAETPLTVRWSKITLRIGPALPDNVLLEASPLTATSAPLTAPGTVLSAAQGWLVSCKSGPSHVHLVSKTGADRPRRVAPSVRGSNSVNFWPETPYIHHSYSSPSTIENRLF